MSDQPFGGAADRRSIEPALAEIPTAPHDRQDHEEHDQHGVSRVGTRSEIVFSASTISVGYSNIIEFGTVLRRYPKSKVTS